MEHALTKECRESIAMDFENPSAKHPSKNVNSASRVTDRQTVQFLYIYIKWSSDEFGFKLCTWVFKGLLIEVLLQFAA